MSVDEQAVIDNFEPLLQDGEELKHWAYGVKQPHVLLIIALFCLGVLPGVIYVVFATKEFAVGLTDRRLLILRVKSVRRVVEGSAVDYNLDAMPPPPRPKPERSSRTFASTAPANPSSRNSTGSHSRTTAATPWPSERRSAPEPQVNTEQI